MKKVKQSRREKKSQPNAIIHWCNEKGLLQSALRQLTIIICIIVIGVVSCQLTIGYIGEGAHEYSEQAYDDIKSEIETHTSNTGVDEEALREAGKIDEYDIKWSKSNKDYKIVTGRIIKTFFVAEGSGAIAVTPTLDDIDDSNNTIKFKFSRNYNSIGEYMSYFWKVFVTITVTLAVLLYIAFLIAWKTLIAIITFFQKKKQPVEGRQPEDSFALESGELLSGASTEESQHADSSASEAGELLSDTPAERNQHADSSVSDYSDAIQFPIEERIIL